jgi:hypothetical protein
MDATSGDTQIRAALRAARIMWAAFIASGFLYVFVAHLLRRTHPHAAPAPSFNWIIAAVAAADIVVIAAVRRNALSRAEAQAMRGESAAAKQSWFSAQVIGLAGGMSIVLFGFVLHQLGAQPAWVPAAFFVAGLLNLAAYYPQLTETR